MATFALALLFLKLAREAGGGGAIAVGPLPAAAAVVWQVHLAGALAAAFVAPRMRPSGRRDIRAGARPDIESEATPEAGGPEGEDRTPRP